MFDRLDLRVNVQKLLFSKIHPEINDITIIRHNRLDSTNEEAKRLIAEKKLKDKTVIITSEQLAGKGQYGSCWISETRQNLLMSIVLCPDFITIEKQFYLNIALALACANALNEYSANTVLIKWPNDLILKNRKVGGILIEQIITGQKINYCIAGIGLNINQQSFPNSLPLAASLSSLENKTFPLNEILHNVLSHILAVYEKLKENAFGELKQDYLRHLIGFEKMRVYKWQGKLVHGKIVGVTNEGKLQMKIDQDFHVFGLKEIEWLPESENL